MLLSILLMATTPVAAEECAIPGTNYGQVQIERGVKPCPDPQEYVAPRLRVSTPAERQAALRYFNDTLRDAPSARWRWSGTWEGGWVCGEVNAKNAMGGYTGWTKFAYRDGAGILSEDGRNDIWGEQAPCLKPQFFNAEDQIRG